MNDNVAIAKVKCPRCGRRAGWSENPHRPFCSEKCRLVDLGCWADEEYRVPGESVSIHDAAEAEDDIG